MMAKETPEVTIGKRGFVPDLAEKAGLGVRIPENENEAAQAEAAFMVEMEKLSIRDREQLVLETVGFNPMQEESPSYVVSKLADLDVELSKIYRKPAYAEAIRGDKRYVASERFRMQFLRAESYNAKNAAHLMVDHFRMKKELFGRGEILSREVVFDDLNEDARNFVRNGYLQVSRSKDNAGRTIFYWGSCVLNNVKSMKSVQQANWYTINAAVRDVEMQINGFVFVVFTGGKPDDLSIVKATCNMRVGFPGCVNALHICNTSPTMRFFLAGVRLLLDRGMRERLREHAGDFDEVDFALQTFGIDTKDSPLRRDGSWSTEWHRQWLHMQYGYEVQNFQSEIIITPRRFDVLFGKTKHAKEHPGTMRCQLLVEMYCEEYDNADRDSKTVVADDIVRVIHARNGRFLKAIGDEGWEEVDNITARHKVTHYFRGMRERRLKREARNGKEKAAAPRKRGTEPLEKVRNGKASPPSFLEETGEFGSG